MARTQDADARGLHVAVIHGTAMAAGAAWPCRAPRPAEGIAAEPAVVGRVGQGGSALTRSRLSDMAPSPFAFRRSSISSYAATITRSCDVLIDCVAAVDRPRSVIGPGGRNRGTAE